MSTKRLRLLLALALLSLCGCGPSASERQARADLAKSQAEATALRQRLTDAQNDLASAQAKILALQEQINKSRPAPEYVVTGEIFITTRGGNSIKLGGVLISVFDRASVDECIKTRGKEIEASLAKLNPRLEQAKNENESSLKAWKAAVARLRGSDTDDFNRQYEAEEALKNVHKKKQADEDKIMQEMREVCSATHYLQMMPSPLLSAKANSDGKFRVALPRSSRLVLAAIATRAVGGETEHYYWLLPLDPPSGDAVEIALSNDNLTSVHSGGSLIYTMD
jgi:hypothetical protein